ncbi:MAG TPA: DHA2 family efflux MFS transporter permease subunit [Desulfobaccales bacterium]|nr:DHA2 family efflux MFS transporter permease subunit [Desulfobaccales bacterium]
MTELEDMGNIAREASSPGHGETAGKWIVLLIVDIGIFMATLDASIVNISLPKISLFFHVPLSGMVEWVIIAYLIVIASLLLILGRLADMVGQKLLWVLGLCIFTLSSALCGAAPSLALLVLFRALQGVGGAMIMALSPAMLTRAFPVTEWGRALGLLAVVVAAGTSAGPALGGIITQAFSWRWIFYVNVPIGILGVIATLRLLKEPMQLRRGPLRFDALGAIVLAVGLCCLMLGLSFGQELGWDSLTIIGLFVAAVVLLAAFVIHEKRQTHPIVDFSLFRNRLFSAAITTSFLCFLSLFAVMFLMPFYLEELLALPVDLAGLLMTAVPLTIAVVAPVSGWLSDRLGSRLLSSAGMAAVCLGLWFLSQLTAQATPWDIVWPLVVTGFGQALFQPPNNNAIMSSVPRQRLGIASGFLSTVRVLGQSSSVAISGAIFVSLGGAEAGAALGRKSVLAAEPLKAVFTHAFHLALITCMVIASIGVFTSLMRGPRDSNCR